MENFETYRLDQTGQQTQAILDQVSTNTADIAQLRALYEALTQSEPVIIQPSDTWPVADPQENVIYRVIDRVNTPPQSYSDYMWNGTAMVLMATYNNSIDSEPTPGSNNLVKSGGVAASIVFDISAYHATGSTLATYSNLAAALGTNGANVPADGRKGGMSVKFVNSSDNKYVQFRYTGTDVTGNPNPFLDTTNWQKQGAEVLGVTTSSVINDCIKELYIPQALSYSDISIFRFYYGSSNKMGFRLFDSSYTILFTALVEKSLNPPVLFTDDSTYYAVFNWDEIIELCGNDGYIDIPNITFNKVVVQNIEYSPFISEYVEKLQYDSKPIYGSDNLVKSGGIYDSFFGEIPFEKYRKYQTHSSAGNVLFSNNNKGLLVASVGETTNTQYMSIGFRTYDTDTPFEANKIYKITTLFLNNGFDMSKFNGMIHAYDLVTYERFLAISSQNVFTVVGNYVKMEYKISHTNPFFLNFFILSQDYSGVTNAGSTLTYLCAKIESQVEDNDTLDGIMFHQMKKYVKENVNEDSLNYVLNKITVTPDANNPCQIANLIRSINDNTIYNRYQIFVTSGQYDEIDIVTKDYIDIVGEDYDKTVLILDADATYNSPANYSFSDQYSGVPVNTIPEAYKHLIRHMSNSTVKNLTLKTITSVGHYSKYICHQDGYANTIDAAVFEHCNFVACASGIIGVGSFANQHYLYKGCQFTMLVRENIDENMTFNLHNSVNQNAISSLRFEDCNFIHCGHILVSELGSGQSDYFELVNCVTDNPVNTFVNFRAADPSNAYDMIVRAVGGNIPLLSDSTRSSSGLMSQALNISMLPNEDGAVFGEALTKDGDKASNANDGFVFAITPLISSSAAASLQTVNLFDVGYAKCEAGVYSKGDAVYINNGKFTKTANGNVAGFVKKAATIESGGGYVMIRKA